MKTILKNRIFSLGIVLVSIISAGIFMQSCSNEDFEYLDINNKDYAELDIVRNVQVPFEDIQSLKFRISGENLKLKSEESQMSYSDSIDWGQIQKYEKKNLIGIFVPFKNCDEDNFRMLASFKIDGEMKEYILQRKRNSDGSFSKEIEYYFLDGSKFEYISSTQKRIPRLKSGNEYPGMESFDDYDEWLNDDSSQNTFANNTNNVVFFKPETTITVGGFTFQAGNSYPLLPGQYTTVPIDGFCMGSTVVKVTDNYSKVSANQGSYTTYYSNPFYGGVNAVYGGVKDDYWLSQHTNQGWESLFNRRQY
jgi:hypothetical protein